MRKRIGKRFFRNFLKLSDFSGSELRSIITLSREMKEAPKGVVRGRLLEQICAKMTLALIFDQPSTRTRISFDLAMRALGGQSLVLTGAEMQLGRGESIADTARVLARYVDAIMIRTLDQEIVEEMARFAGIPVINGLTKTAHPCQIMADILTFEEKRGTITGQCLAWLGDCNNVLASWIEAARQFNFQLRIATPPEIAQDFSPLADPRLRENLVLTEDKFEAARDAACVMTDCWVSMGDDDTERRHALLRPYQVSAEVLSVAQPNALFMHCLPAHRQEEVTDAVLDGPHSVIFDEAENRLHVQKGILSWCLGIFEEEEHSLEQL